MAEEAALATEKAVPAVALEAFVAVPNTVFVAVFAAVVILDAVVSVPNTVFVAVASVAEATALKVISLPTPFIDVVANLFVTPG